MAERRPSAGSSALNAIAQQEQEKKYSLQGRTQVAPRVQTMQNARPTVRSALSNLMRDAVDATGLEGGYRQGLLNAAGGVETAVDFLPVVGDVLGLEDASRAYGQGDMVGAGINMMGVVPIIGDAGVKLSKKTRSALRDSGFTEGFFHGTKQDIQDGFKAGYGDGMVFVTPEREFANNWVGKGKYQQRLGEENIDDMRRADRQKLWDEYESQYGSYENWPSEIEDEYNARSMNLTRQYQASGGAIYPVAVKANKQFDPEENPEVIAEFLKSQGRDPNATTIVSGKTDLEAYQEGNYLFYENKEMADFLKEKGYDSVWLREDTTQSGLGKPFSTLAVLDETGVKPVYDFAREADADTRSALNYDTTDLYSDGGRQGTAIVGGSALHNLKMRAVNGDESAIAELMTIEGLDKDNVVRRLQNYVARYEGQSPEQRAIEYNASKPVRLGQSTEERMQRSSEQGYSGPYYTGAGRLDRLLEKDQILPERATSGPMPFFTTDPELASSYAKNKRDTSLDLTDNKEAFTVNPVDLNLPRDREITVEDSWNYLDPDKKSEILNKVERIGYEDLDNFEGKFVLHPEGVKGLPSSKDHFDYIMRTEAKGNPLAALRELWLDSGNLYDKEELMEVIYKLSGFPARISQINAPWTEASGVLPVMMRLKNPVDTTNTDSLKQTVIPALREAFSDPKYNVKSEAFGVDQWDKNTRFTPKEWVEQLAEDVSKGENSYVWTSIPDEVTLQLEKLGFDSIIDVSGKGGGDIKEKVVIPFKPNQVRSVNAEFDPEKIDSADLLSSRQSERQMSALRGIA